MQILALVLAAGAIAWAALNHRRFAILREDLRYIHRTSRLEREKLEKKLAALEKQLAERPTAAAADSPTGSWFTPYMTIQDALNVHPGIKEVLASLHIGGCSSCSVSSRETLEQAAAGHGVDLGEMLRRMNAVMDGETPPKESPAAPPDPLAEAEKALPPANGGRIMLGIQPPARQ